MKTIIERAEYYERRCIDNANALGWSELPRPLESYKQGANEQKAIDKMEGEALLYVANKVAERTKKEMINKACKWLKYRNEYPFTNAIIESFKEYMEDEDNYGHN